MRTKPNKNFPAIHAACERSSETRYRKIKELFDRLHKANRFAKGQFVKWKPGLRNKAFPDYGEPAIVMAVLTEAIFDPSENTAASPRFGHRRERRDGPPHPRDLLGGAQWEESPCPNAGGKGSLRRAEGKYKGRKPRLGRRPPSLCSVLASPSPRLPQSLA
jgi:hypothetical protein